MRFTVIALALSGGLFAGLLLFQELGRLHVALEFPRPGLIRVRSFDQAVVDVRASMR